MRAAAAGPSSAGAPQKHPIRTGPHRTHAQSLTHGPRMRTLGRTRQVLDKDRCTKDNALGEVQVSLEPLLQRDLHDFSEPLSERRGSLSFSVAWTGAPRPERVAAARAAGLVPIREMVDPRVAEILASGGAAG